MQRHSHCQLAGFSPQEAMQKISKRKSTQSLLHHQHTQRQGEKYPSRMTNSEADSTFNLIYIKWSARIAHQNNYSYVI